MDRFEERFGAGRRRKGDQLKTSARGSKRAPVLFCVDASYSMMNLVDPKNSNRVRMDLLNDMIRGFFEEILKDEVRDKVEVAFMVFSDKVLMETDFVRITNLQETDFSVRTNETYIDPRTGHANVCLKKLSSSEKRDGYLYPMFKVAEEDEGTDIGTAVLHAVNKLMMQKENLRQWGSYPATLILVTDGDPEPEAVDTLDYLSEKEREALKTYRAEAQEKAIKAVADHCYTHTKQDNLILPFIIGVGDESCKTDLLDRYAGQLVNKAFHIRDKKAEECFKILVKVICKSVTNSTTSNDIIEMAKKIVEGANVINAEQEEEEYDPF